MDHKKDKKNNTKKAKTTEVKFQINCFRLRNCNPLTKVCHCCIMMKSKCTPNKNTSFACFPKYADTHVTFNGFEIT